MLDIRHSSSAAPIRRFSLNLFSYFYSTIYTIAWIYIIAQKWKIIRLSWKQLLSLLALGSVEWHVRSHFKTATRVMTPFGTFHPIFFFAYASISLAAAFAAAHHIATRLEHHFEKKQKFPICAVVGGYYIGYYLVFTLLNILLIAMDYSNIL
ncbi:hypothetical protein PMAYCL1PPCAC_33292, partial [Pristionchus mayeri]